MGLDITAYSHLEFIGDHNVPNRFCTADDYSHIQAFAYRGFEASFRGLSIINTVHDDQFIYGGCYEKTAETKTHAFRAGSYTGYGIWRQMLAELFNPTDYDQQSPDPDKPFYELIWFADNEGTIGPEAALDLWQDFVANRDAFMTYVTAPGPDCLPEHVQRYFIEPYDDWTKAFDLARHDGLVVFH